MIRLARNDDMMELFTLANDEMARANSIHQDKISLYEHKAWFANKLKSKDAKIYILQKDKIIGACRIEKEANSDFWVVSVIIRKDFRGLGLGKKCLIILF